jgi:hypothetical protein
MYTETKKVLAIVALIVATGISAVELSHTSAQADPMLVVGGAAGYAGHRVDQAFEAVATLPAPAPEIVNVAEKGDLPPLGCAGPFHPDVAAECLDTAYEVESGPYVIVEKRDGEATSVLTRMIEYTVAGF